MLLGLALDLFAGALMFPPEAPVGEIQRAERRVDARAVTVCEDRFGTFAKSRGAE